MKRIVCCFFLLISFFLSGCYSSSQIEDAKRDGYKEGYSEGYASGYEAGYLDGNAAGWEEAAWEYGFDASH